jgi:hypothetical protein
MWDNKIFNVNGHGLDMLTRTLKLVNDDDDSFRGLILDANHGLIWLWTNPHISRAIIYDIALSARQAAEITMQWLESNEPKPEMTGWDANADHDGDNKLGWRVYVEDWGDVGSINCAICAVRPAYLWYGK